MKSFLVPECNAISASGDALFHLGSQGYVRCARIGMGNSMS